MKGDNYVVDGGEVGAATSDVPADRQQYISKIPSSSFLRVPVEPTDKKSVTDAEFSVQESYQQQVIDRFLEFSDVVRGSCLHLLRRHDDPALIQGFQKDICTPLNQNGQLVANGNPEHRRQACIGPNRPDTVTFRLIEGGICISSRRPSVSSVENNGFKTRPTDGSANGIRCDSSGVDEEECGVFGHTESFLQMAHAELSCSGYGSGARDADGSTTALRIQNRTVIMAGNLIPLALDDTVVIEHKVSLDLDHSPSNDHMANGKHNADDQKDRFERVRDIFHSYAYQGLLRLGTGSHSGRQEDFCEVVQAGRRGSNSQVVDASLMVLSRQDRPEQLSIFYHFKDRSDALLMMDSPDWSKMQHQLGQLVVTHGAVCFRGLVHTLRENTGLCSGPPVVRAPKLVVEPLGVPRDTCNWAAQHDGSAVVEEDSKLHACIPQLQERYAFRSSVLGKICEKFGDILQFAEGHKVFGFQRVAAEASESGIGGWRYREWLPNAKAAFLFGDFNNWNRTSHPLQRDKRDVSPHYFECDLGLNPTKDHLPLPDCQLGGVWSIFLPDRSDGSWLLQHRCRVRVLVHPTEGEPFDRVPAWVPVAWKDEESGLLNGVVWHPPPPEKYTFRYPRPSFPRDTVPCVYEAHIGSSSGEEGRVGTFVDFTNQIIRRISYLGYNTLLLLDVIEHADFSSFGIGVTNHFAISSRLGTIEEFKALVDCAHLHGLRVCVSLWHSHSSRNALEGLGCMDGGDSAYFVAGPGGELPNWSQARAFDLRKAEVLRFLLSNIKFLLSEYCLDGFRFEGVTSMLYRQHGLGRQFDPFNYSSFFSDDVSTHSVLYLSLANILIASLLPIQHRLSIAHEWSGFPTLCRDVSKGGLGFDYRYDAEWGQSLRRLIRESGHRQGRWITSQVVWAMANKPNTEKVIAGIEDADSTRVCRRRMHVALFAWESLHTHAVGGVAPHVTELAAGLARLGHDVHVFVRATGCCGGCTVHYGVTYHECTFELNRDFVIEINNMCESFVACMLSVEEAMGAEFDICHGHDWLGAKAMIRAKQIGRTAILTMHSTEFGRCGNNNYGGMSKRIRDIEDRVICVSGVLADEVKGQYGIHPAKLTVIYNGINCDKFDGEVNPGEVKQSYGLGAMDPMFLFVGRMVVQKGPDLFLEAIRFILNFRSDAKFVFVGDGHMLESLKCRAGQLGVSGSVRFVGKMGGIALQQLFKSCDAVVVPSRNEPFGIVVLEAWSAGKPVVATNSGGPRDFVNPNVTGILVDPEPGSIAWGCCEILKNFEHARWMGSRGRVTAAFSFSWDSIAKQTREIYYEQKNKHDVPPDWCKGSEGDETMAFTLIGPAMYDHMSVEDQEPRVLQGLALWRLYKLLLSSLFDGVISFMGNEFAHPDALDLPRPSNHFSMARAFRRWTLSDTPALKFTQCELFESCTTHWQSIFKWQAAPHLFVVLCDEERQVVVFERGHCLFAFNFHPSVSYEGFHVGCMYDEPLRHFLDTDEQRFGGFGRLTPNSSHPIFNAKDGRPHSVKVYLPSSTCAVYVRESIFVEKEALRKAFPVLNMDLTDYVDRKISSNSVA